MAGLKRKIPIKKIEKKDPRAVAFSKRRQGLYSKAAQLCLLSDAEIAILATPVSSDSNVSFYSFGHSSVDSVVTAFLTNQRPTRDKSSGFWWEDERLTNSDNLDELRDAIVSMSTMLEDLKEYEKQRELEDLKKKKKKGVSHGTDHQKQTLNPQPYSVILPDGINVDVEGFHKNTDTNALDECNQNLDLELDLDLDLDFDLDFALDFDLDFDFDQNLDGDGSL